MSDYLKNIMKSTTVDVECSYGTEIVLSELYENIYNKAIDDFAELLKSEFEEYVDACAKKLASKID